MPNKLNSSSEAELSIACDALAIWNSVAKSSGT